MNWARQTIHCVTISGHSKYKLIGVFFFLLFRWIFWIVKQTQKSTSPKNDDFLCLFCYMLTVDREMKQIACELNIRVLLLLWSSLLLLSEHTIHHFELFRIVVRDNVRQINSEIESEYNQRCHASRLDKVTHFVISTILFERWMRNLQSPWIVFFELRNTNCFLIRGTRSQDLREFYQLFVVVCCCCSRQFNWLAYILSLSITHTHTFCCVPFRLLLLFCPRFHINISTKQMRQ